MDIRQLTAFIAVAQERSFTRAAARLHTVQSAVSATVRSLESELGAPLPDRTLSQIETTSAGEALLPKARLVLDALAEAPRLIDEVAGGVSGTVAVGFLTSVTLVNIPALLGEFVSRYPNVRVVLRASDRGSGGLGDLLVAGELDIAFMGASASERPDLVTARLASSPLLLTVPEGHPLAGRTSIALNEIVDESFVDFPAGFANRSIVDHAFASEGLSREVRLETADIADAAALVRHGLGVSFLPQFLVDPFPDLRTIRIEGHDIALVMTAAVSKQRRVSRAAGHLWDLAVASAADSGRLTGAA